MGSGSTIAAAKSVGYRSTGVEIDHEYFRLAVRAVPALARLGAGGAQSAHAAVQLAFDAVGA
jgi:DNA modification methylase